MGSCDRTAKRVVDGRDRTSNGVKGNRAQL